MAETGNSSGQNLEFHDRAVRIVAEAVVGLATRFAHIPADSIAEGAIKAAAILMMAQGDSLGDVADLFEDFADILRSGEGEAWPTVN